MMLRIDQGYQHYPLKPCSEQQFLLFTFSYKSGFCNEFSSITGAYKRYQNKKNCIGFAMLKTCVPGIFFPVEKFITIPKIVSRTSKPLP